MTGPLFDPGLQPERTALAWRRTALSMVVGAVMLMRLAHSALGAAALTVAASALGGVVAMQVLAGLRSRRVHRSLAAESVIRVGGRSLLAVACMTSTAATVALALAIVGV